MPSCVLLTSVRRQLSRKTCNGWAFTPRIPGASPRALTLNYGLRYDTTFGLFIASGHSQAFNPSLSTGLVNGIPHDYRKAFAPRIGIAQVLGSSGKTVLRAGFGLFYNDLAQNGWVNAFTAVNSFNLANGTSPAALIDPNYHTPYAIHATAGVQHALSANWMVGADYTLETGMHAYRRYGYEEADVYRTDNRSSYQGLSLRVQGNVGQRVHLTAHYTAGQGKYLGLRGRRTFRLRQRRLRSGEPFRPG